MSVAMSNVGSFLFGANLMLMCWSLHDADYRTVKVSAVVAVFIVVILATH